MASQICAYNELFDNRSLVKEIVDSHNVYRRLHNVQPLMLNDELSARCQQVALMGAPIVDGDQTPEIGENIYIVNTKDPCYPLRGEDIVNEWYHQTYLTRANEHGAGRPYNMNFTQIVWKDSRMLGVGVNRDMDKIVVVCQYYPAGNISGEFTRNILPVFDEEEQLCYPHDFCLI